jgi:hypothetical protein
MFEEAYAATVELIGFIFLVVSIVYLNVSPELETHKVLFWLAVAFSVAGAVGMVIAGPSKRLKLVAN